MHVRVHKSRFSSVQTIIVKRIIERSTWVLGKVSPRFKITDFNRALSPPKLHRRIVAEETYGRAQQRASFIGTAYFMRTFLPLH